MLILPKFICFISFFALENAAIFDHTFLVADNDEVVHSTVITAPRARGIITIVVAGVIAPSGTHGSWLAAEARLIPFGRAVRLAGACAERRPGVTGRTFDNCFHICYFAVAGRRGM